MSKTIEDGLAHFRAKLIRHLKIVNACYAEIDRLEKLRQSSNLTGTVDLTNESDVEIDLVVRAFDDAIKQGVR